MPQGFYDYTANHSSWFAEAGYRVLGVGDGFITPLLTYKGKRKAEFANETPVYLIEGFAKIHHSQPFAVKDLVRNWRSILPTLKKSDQGIVKKLFCPRAGRDVYLAEVF